MHQIRAVSLFSYLDVARFVGLDGLSLLSTAGIAPGVLGEVDVRLPAAPVVNLLEQSAKLARCDSFGIRMAQCRSYASLGAISLLLERLANLSAVLQALIDQPRALSDVLFVAISVDKGTVSATFDMVEPFNKPQSVDLTIGLGFIALSGASGGRWHPEEVHFTHGRPSDVAPFEAFFRAPLIFNSHFNGFLFAARGLQTPLPLADPAMARNAAKLIQSVNLPELRGSVADHARHSIALLLPEGRASLKNVATNLDLSPRELQRKLRQETQSYEALLNSCRRETALRVLSNPTASLTDIAHALGYADQTSFTRWFRNEFRTTPTSWRKKERSAAQGPPPIWRV